VELESTTIVSIVGMSSGRIDSMHFLIWLREFQVVKMIDRSVIHGSLDNEGEPNKGKRAISA
jgi:hypothetical protein